jgi:2-desacetyl-2-hydroxyethyl bacteriochlorophyllide A dehydrogenase
VELGTASAKPPARGEVRINALFSGISHGTEMLVYRGEVPTGLSLDSSLPTLQGSFGFPVKYGYANVGRVVDAGAGVEGFSEGDLVVALNPHETCYTVPVSAVIKLPPELDPRVGVFAANLETAVNTLLDAAPRLGETVVVIGQGVVGLLIARLARRAGAGLIVTSDLHERRRQLSKSGGADVVLDPSAENLAEHVSALTHGAGADVVIEASGRPKSIDDAIRVASVEGRVVLVSWYGTNRAELDLGGEFHRKRVTLKTSQVSSIDSSLRPRWTRSRRRALAVRYLGELCLDELITHIIPFDEAAQAYRLIDERPGEVVQVVLDYNSGEYSRRGDG